MKNLPAIGSTITVNCQYYTGAAKFEGVVVNPYRWLSTNEFCLQTGNKEFPVSVINLANVVDLNILKGSTTSIRKFKVKGSKNDEYIVTLTGNHYSCPCIGFKYHNKCKHITKVKEKITS
jgi:hypothetical protein